MTTAKNIRDLFERLSEPNKEHSKRSYFLDGLAKVGPYLEELRIVVGFVSTFTSAEPIMATVLRLVNGVVTVAVAICGAAEELTGDLKGLLERIPTLECCDEALRSKNSEAASRCCITLILS